MLRGFVDRIPVDAPGNWPTHVAGHPPGALLFFVGLVGDRARQRAREPDWWSP